MINYTKASEYVKPHTLKSKIHFDGFAEGSLKDCFIQKMSDGRLAVMAVSYQDYFYKVFSGNDELEESFDEVQK